MRAIFATILLSSLLFDVNAQDNIIQPTRPLFTPSSCNYNEARSEFRHYRSKTVISRDGRWVAHVDITVPLNAFYLYDRRTKIRRTIFHPYNVAQLSAMVFNPDSTEIYFISGSMNLGISEITQLNLETFDTQHFGRRGRSYVAAVRTANEGEFIAFENFSNLYAQGKSARELADNTPLIAVILLYNHDKQDRYFNFSTMKFEYETSELVRYQPSANFKIGYIGSKIIAAWQGEQEYTGRLAQNTRVDGKLYSLIFEPEIPGSSIGAIGEVEASIFRADVDYSLSAEMDSIHRERFICLQDTTLNSVQYPDELEVFNGFHR